MAKTEEIIGVEGMCCGNCEVAVKKAIWAVDGVEKVKVELRSKLVMVEFDPARTELAKIKEAIEEQGYDVK